MTEKEFINKNRREWEALEKLLKNTVTSDADELNRLFIKVSSDLAYARTFFPNRSVRVYLNALTQEVFDKLKKKEKKLNLDGLTRFFGTTLPLEIYRSQKYLLISFLIFFSAVGIGVLSTVNNPEFTRTILGDMYVDMTESNINEGDPMAVYKQTEQSDMFFRITLNNIRVSFLAFVLGILGSLGTIYVLISNGIMLGTFQYFFHTKGLFFTSFLTIWIHGTIEISAIIIAGAAGFILGSGLLFPKTYSRVVSLQIAANRAIRILLGTVPLFIIAGILESFVTRLTDLPVFVKLLIIGASLFLILFMWVFYPMYCAKRNKRGLADLDLKPVHQSIFKFEKYNYRSLSENVSNMIVQTKLVLGRYFKHILVPGLLIFAFLFWIALHQKSSIAPSFSGWIMFKIDFGGLLIYFTLVMYVVFALSYLLSNYFESKYPGGILYILRFHALELFFIVSIWLLPFAILDSFNYIAMSYLVLTLQFPLVYFAVCFTQEHKSFGFKLNRILTKNYSNYFDYIIPSMILTGLFFVLTLLANSGLVYFIEEMVIWHNIFPDAFRSQIFTSNLVFVAYFSLLIPIYFYLNMNTFFSLECRDEGIDLRKKLDRFGQQNVQFE